jgi:hypothetical protein
LTRVATVAGGALVIAAATTLALSESADPASERQAGTSADEVHP